MTEATKTLPEACEELALAQQALEAATQEAAFARSVEISALNRVNQAQKQIDALLAKLRESAHRDSDWRRLARQGHSREPGEP